MGAWYLYPTVKVGSVDRKNKVLAFLGKKETL